MYILHAVLTLLLYPAGMRMRILLLLSVKTDRIGPAGKMQGLRHRVIDIVETSHQGDRDKRMLNLEEPFLVAVILDLDVIRFFIGFC